MLSSGRVCFRHLPRLYCSWKPLGNYQRNVPVSSVLLRKANFSTEDGRTVKVFQPSFKDTEYAKVDSEDRKSPLIEKKDDPALAPRVRKLGKLDKMLLVRIGKYKDISEVPDEIKVGNLKKKKEVDDEMRDLLLGSVFKYLFMFEYASFFITFTLLGFALYWYNNYRKGSDTSSDLNTIGPTKLD